MNPKVDGRKKAEGEVSDSVSLENKAERDVSERLSSVKLEVVGLKRVPMLFGTTWNISRVEELR